MGPEVSQPPQARLTQARVIRDGNDILLQAPPGAPLMTPANVRLMLNTADCLRFPLGDTSEQLRAAGLSVSNNIAEGSGSEHVNEFKQFLNIARRSLFEDASMLLVPEMKP